MNVQAAEQLAGGHRSHSVLYMWSVFALTFGLMLSDYLTRNVMSAVFPFLKAEWTLSDRELGTLVSVVALVVGLGSFPIALLADRWGRVKSITAMAAIWCLATIGCGLASGYAQMIVARGFVGLGEAGYGSAGGAILSHVFPPQQRAVVIGAFLAAALFGSVLGVALGGVVAVHFGWRTAFVALGAASLLLVIVYPIVVRDYKTVSLVQRDSRSGAGERRMRLGEMIRELFAPRTAMFTYVGSGLQMFINGVLAAWMPSFFAREYALGPDAAAVQAAIVVLMAGVGMIVGGWAVDRASRRRARNRLRVPAMYGLLTFALLTTAFALSPGDAQRVLILFGALFMGGHAGAAGAAISEVVHPGLRASAFAVLTLSNNLLGLAPGPVLVGALSDAFGLRTALALAPTTCFVAAACFLVAAHYYERERNRFEEPTDELAEAPAAGFAGH